MPEPPLRMLLEGRPAVGKTTVARRLAALLGDAGVPLAGFVTGELRERGRRVGFTVETFEGASAVLAHVGLPGHLESEGTASTCRPSSGSPFPRWRHRPTAVSC